MKYFSWLVYLIFLLSNSLFCPSRALAASKVTVRVPDETKPSIPILIAPPNQSVLSENKPSFVFKKSTDPQSAIWYYQLWLNGGIFFPELASAQSPVETAEYLLVADEEQISVTLKQALADGLYLWSIRAVDVYSNWADSAVWSFTIDTISPFIIITQISGQSGLNLSSQDPDSIPDGLVIITDHIKPNFIGQTESRANIQITLIPYGPSGELQPHRKVILSGQADDNGQFDLLCTRMLPPGLWQVQVFASDQAGNTSSLKFFDLEITRGGGPTAGSPISTGLPGLLYFIPFASLVQKEPNTLWLLLLVWLFFSMAGYGFGFCRAFAFLTCFLLPRSKKDNNRLFDIKRNKGVAFGQINVFKLSLPQDGQTAPEPFVRLYKRLLANKKGYFKIKDDDVIPFSLEAMAFAYIFPADKNTIDETENREWLYYYGQILSSKQNLRLLLPMQGSGNKVILRKMLLLSASLILMLALLTSIYNLVYQSSPANWLSFGFVLYLILCSIC